MMIRARTLAVDAIDGGTIQGDGTDGLDVRLTIGSTTG
jgi:hypothetical protein